MSTINCSTSEKTAFPPDCWFQKEGGKDTLSYISGAEVEQVNSYGSLCHYNHCEPLWVITSTPCSKKHRKGSTSYRNLGRLYSRARFNFYGGAIESIKIGNITNWHGSSGPLCSRWFKLPRTSLLPIYSPWPQWSETSAQSPKDTKGRHSLQSQSVHPAAIQQEMHKYLLPYKQITEQLHSPGHGTTQFICNSFVFDTVALWEKCQMYLVPCM